MGARAGTDELAPDALAHLDEGHPPHPLRAPDRAGTFLPRQDADVRADRSDSSRQHVHLAGERVLVHDCLDPVAVDVGVAEMRIEAGPVVGRPLVGRQQVEPS